MSAGAPDGEAATIEAHVVADKDSVYGRIASVSGAVPVSAGAHTVSLQARVALGWAFLIERAVTTLFVPGGQAAIRPASRSLSGPSHGDGSNEAASAMPRRCRST